MTRIESKAVVVEAQISDCYNFLLDLNNYELLLPKDKISNWESNEKQCSFKIQNTYKLSLEFYEGVPVQKVHIKSGEGSPFSFDLFVDLKEEGGNTNAQLICDADINPFLKMMVQKPLNNLFDYMAERLAKVKAGKA